MRQILDVLDGLASLLPNASILVNAVPCLRLRQVLRSRTS